MSGIVAMRHAILPGLVSLLAGCAAMQSAPPERLAELKTKGAACGEALPAIRSYEVDRFGHVRASAEDPEAEMIERNFFDCISSRGRWATWEAGQPAPMLEPVGTEDPEPDLGRRVP